MTSYKSVRIAACLSTLLTGTAAGLAAPSAVAEEADGLVDEIVVTARKREEKLQDVPAAITAFSARAIGDAGVANVSDVTLLVPNLSIANTQNMGTVFINIRGVGQYRNSEPPVAMVIDGVQITSPNQITQDLYDIERIEVLKGPQGSLYGRNASGGAINIVTRQPTNEFEGLVRATYANGEDWRGQAVLSGPIIPDKLLFRVAGSYRDTAGLLRNVTLDRKVDFLEDRNLRLRLLFTPTDALQLDLRGSISDADGGASWFVPLPDASANDFDVPIQADALGRGSRTLKDAALKIDYDLGFATVTSISSLASVEEFFFEDLEWLPLPILTADQDLDTATFSEELRLASPSTGRLRWLAGAYYLDTKRDLVTFVDVVGVTRLAIGNLRDDNKAWALFGNVEYDLTPSLKFALGLRYDEDRRRQTDRIQAGAISRATFDELQPKVTLSWQATDEVLAYASYGSGFRSGGFNATATFGRQYRPEVVTSGELGVKSTWAGGRFVLNAAAFYSDFDNLQQYVLDVNSGGQAIVSVPNARVYGLELEAQAQPVDNLQLTASLGLQRSRIKSELIGFDPNAVGYPPGFTFVGKRVPLVYPWSYVLGAQYRWPLSDRARLTLRADYSARGGNYWEANNLDKQSAVHIVNARAAVEFGSLEVVVWAQNLFDEEYFEEFVSREFAGTIADVGFLGRPRTYGVTTTFRF